MIYSIATVRMHWRLLEILLAKVRWGTCKNLEVRHFVASRMQGSQPDPNSVEMTL
jgi:hypothetical protein